MANGHTGAPACRRFDGTRARLGTGIERGGQGDHGGVLTVDGPYIKKFIVKHHMKKDLKLRIVL